METIKECACSVLGNKIQYIFTALHWVVDGYLVFYCTQGENRLIPHCSCHELPPTILIKSGAHSHKRGGLLTQLEKNI